MIQKIEPKIVIVDYGVGNLHSLAEAIRQFTNNVTVTEDADTISSADGIVLPGVGAFEAGMSGLKIRGLIETVKKLAQENRPILGICLGAQLILSKGYEFGEFDGLNIIPGKVVHFPELASSEKVPHIGWNKIYSPENPSWNSKIFDNVPNGTNVYFVHSYILVPENESDILALSTYGDHEFCAAICKGKIYGVQFHPEKSGKIGLQIIDNFVNLTR